MQRRNVFGYRLIMPIGRVLRTLTNLIEFEKKPLKSPLKEANPIRRDSSNQILFDISTFEAA